MSVKDLRPHAQTSYPLLWIARAFHVDYGDVLAYADWWQFFNWFNGGRHFDVGTAEADPHFVFDHWKTKAKNTLPIECKRYIVGYCRTGRIMSDASWNGDGADGV